MLNQKDKLYELPVFFKSKEFLDTMNRKTVYSERISFALDNKFAVPSCILLNIENNNHNVNELKYHDLSGKIVGDIFLMNYDSASNSYISDVELEKNAPSLAKNLSLKLFSPFYQQVDFPSGKSEMRISTLNEKSIEESKKNAKGPITK